MKTKLTIMKNKPKASNEEIQNYMNFDSILESRDKALKVQQSKSFLKKMAVGIVAGVVIIPLIWMAFKEDQAKNIQTSKKPVHSREAQSNQVTPIHEKLNKVTRPEKGEHKKEIMPATPLIIKPEIKKEEEVKLESNYVQAEPVNGYAALYDYFNRSLIYPPNIKKDSIIEGIVTVKFMINKEGRPDEIKIENSLGAAFDRESIRVIEEMPQWKPALLNGKPVASRVSIPLTFHSRKVN